jgi:HNH endonuclease
MNRADAAAIARATKAAKTPPLEERFWSKVERRSADECWPWKACARKKSEGYGAFWLNGRHQPASRVAWLLTCGLVSSEDEVCHRCDNPPCCNPKHLFIGSRQDNNADKVSKRRHAFGARVGTAKLTENNTAEIKRLKPSGVAPPGFIKSLAEKFDVSSRTIQSVWAGRWTHLN